MSLKYRDSQGNETPVAGLNGTSGELVPSVSYYKSGTYTPQETTSLEPKANVTVSVSFAEPMPDENYEVILQNRSAPQMMYVPRNKTATGFDIFVYNGDSDAHSIASIAWTAFKLMTDESRALDEQAIAQNTADIAVLQDYTYTKLTSDDNIDDLVTVGNYGGYNGANIGGTFPYTGNEQFVITVTKAKDYIYQICHMGEHAWQRYAHGGTPVNWSSWRSFVTESDLYGYETEVTVTSDSSGSGSSSDITLQRSGRAYYVMALGSNYGHAVWMIIPGWSTAQIVKLDGSSTVTCTLVSVANARPVIQVGIINQPNASIAFKIKPI